MFTKCLKKQSDLKEIFEKCKSAEALYQKIMELGRTLKKMDSRSKTESNLVKGCQSVMYLEAKYENGTMIFNADSDALISLGLAALLIFIYSGETPETILKCPPTCFDELGLTNALSPNRANGLYQIHLKMKQEALKALTH